MARVTGRLARVTGPLARVTGPLARVTGPLANPPRAHRVDTGAVRPSAKAGASAIPGGTRREAGSDGGRGEAAGSKRYGQREGAE